MIDSTKKFRIAKTLKRILSKREATPIISKMIECLSKIIWCFESKDSLVYNPNSREDRKIYKSTQTLITDEDLDPTIPQGDDIFYSLKDYENIDMLVKELRSEVAGNYVRQPYNYDDNLIIDLLFYYSEYRNTLVEEPNESVEKVFFKLIDEDFPFAPVSDSEKMDYIRRHYLVESLEKGYICKIKNRYFKISDNSEITEVKPITSYVDINE